MSREKIKRKKELQIEKDDVLEFPNVIRDFHPSREANPDGSKGREWRADAPASSGKRLEAHTGDTQPEFLQQAGQELSTKRSVDSNSNNASKFMSEMKKPLPRQRLLTWR